MGISKRHQEEGTSMENELKKSLLSWKPREESVSNKESGNLGQMLLRGQLGRGLNLATWKSLPHSLVYLSLKKKLFSNILKQKYSFLRINH